jgi:hypothetical protein
LQGRLGKARVVDGADRRRQSAREHLRQHGAVAALEPLADVGQTRERLGGGRAGAPRKSLLANASLPPTLKTKWVASSDTRRSWRRTSPVVLPSTATSVALAPGGNRWRTCLTTSGAPAT